MLRSIPANLVPAGAYVFTTEDALLVHLNQTFTVDNIEPGDVLLASDPRFVPGERTSFPFSHLPKP